MVVCASGGDEFWGSVGFGAAAGAGERGVGVDEPCEAEVGELDGRGGGGRMSGMGGRKESKIK